MLEAIQSKSPEDSTPTTDAFSWGPKMPRGAKTLFARIIKEGANVPLFIGQTLVNALRDLGYNDTTAAVCEFVDNSIHWGAKEVRIYFNESGKKGQNRIDVLVVDDGAGMAPTSCARRQRSEAPCVSRTDRHRPVRDRHEGRGVEHRRGARHHLVTGARCLLRHDIGHRRYRRGPRQRRRP